MNTHPAAYLRRSYVDAESPGDISRDAQRAAVAKLAAADGHNGNLIEYDDWGVSADVAKSAKRIAFSRLLEDMEAGRIASVYAFDVDRLYRDPRDLMRLQDAAQRHRVRIVTTGGPLAIGDGDDPAAEGFAFMGAVFGRMELQKIKKRNRAARAARVQRGDRFGHPPYGWRHVRDESGRIIRVPDPERPVKRVLEVYREAGTILGAVKELNRRGIPAAKGGRWYTSALTRLVEQNAPGLLPRKGAGGKRIRPTKNPSYFSQLVRCHCGATMTPNTVRKQLYCSRGIGDAQHGRYVASEVYILPWVMAEAERMTIPADLASLGEVNVEQRRDLMARRERLGLDLVHELLPPDTVAAMAAEIDAQLALLDEQEELVELPAGIDWSWSPSEINVVLRAWWSHVQLGPDMRPVRAEWRVPLWRRDD